MMTVFVFLCCSQNGNLQAFPINLLFDLVFPEFFVCLLLFVLFWSVGWGAGAKGDSYFDCTCKGGGGFILCL